MLNPRLQWSKMIQKINICCQIACFSEHTTGFLQVRDYGEGHAYNSMLVDCTGIDPDDAFSKIPYEKGSALLMYLEQQLGGPG